MVKGRVPPHASGQLFPRVQAQGQARDRRTEDVADNCHQAVGDRHRPEARPREDDGSADAQHGKRQADRSALGARLVDRGADRRLDGKPEQTTDRGDQSDFGLAPMLLGDQEHVEIRPQRAADIGEQEVAGVKRERVETLTNGRCHSHSHSVPIARVMMVSGAPTLK
jgi:hypothetical protein